MLTPTVMSDLSPLPHSELLLSRECLFHCAGKYIYHICIHEFKLYRVQKGANLPNQITSCPTLVWTVSNCDYNMRSVLLGFYAVSNIISVISRRMFTYTWSLGRHTSSMLVYAPCQKALHHDQSAATGDRTRGRPVPNPRRKPLGYGGFHI